MTIESVVFDWGGVLTGNASTMFAELEQGLGVPAGSMPELLGLHPFATDTENLWHRRELGLATAREWAEWYAARVVAAGGVAIPPDQLVAGERERFVTEPNAPVIDAVRRLKQSGLRTAICTNNFAELGDAWRSMLPLDLFDVVAVSCELGVRKPDAAMFEHVTAALGTTPESTVLLDDFEGNVDGARAAGWQAILVGADHGAAIADLDELIASQSSPSNGGG